MGGSNGKLQHEAARLTRVSTSHWTIRLEDGKAIVCATGADALERECQKPTLATKDYLAKMRNREMVPDEGKALLFDIFDSGRFTRGEARIIERAFEWTAWGKPVCDDDIKPDPAQEKRIIDAEVEAEALVSVKYAKMYAREAIRARRHKARSPEAERLAEQERAADEEFRLASEAADRAKSKVADLIQQRVRRKAVLLGQQTTKAST